MKKKFSPAYGGFSIGNCFQKQLFPYFLLSNRLPLHEFLKFQNIIITVISNAVPFATVASCPSGLLIIPLKTFRYIIMYYESDVWFINAHSKSNSGYNYISLLHQELVLIQCAGSRIHTGMIRKSPDTIYLEDFSNLLYLFSAQAINNS